MKNLLLPIIISIGVLFLTSGCVPVEDIGEYWDKGIIDPKLEGHWKKQGTKFRSQDEYVSFLKSESYYIYQTKNADTPDDWPSTQIPTRTIVLGKHHFLLYRDVDLSALESDPNNSITTDNKSGGLQKYKIQGNTLIFYMLDEKVLAEAIKTGQVEGSLNENDAVGPSIKKLDEESIKFIMKVATQKKHWKQRIKYSRIKNIEEALRISRAYPATKKTRRNTLVNIYLPDLKYFAEDKTDILLRHLQSTPKWKVFEDQGEILCYKRQNKNNWGEVINKWRVSLNGNEHNWQTGTSRQESYQIRFLFRLAKKPFGPYSGPYAPWSKRSHVIKVSPLEGKIQLKLKSDDQGIQSDLAIGQEGLWFEFFEQTQKEQRTKTREALKWLEEFLKTLRESEQEINEKGFVSKLMPPGAIKHGKPSIQIEDSFQGGIYDVFAWVNPTKKGYVYLKAFNTETKEQLSEKRLKKRSKEYIGRSKDSSSLFFYNCHVTIYEGDWDHFYNARFELWFHPDDGGPERKLLEITRDICGWQR